MQNQRSKLSLDLVITEINTHPNSSTMPSQEILSYSSSQDFDVLMDEDMGDLDLGEIYLLGLEDACKKRSFHTIAPKKIHLLKEVLNKAKMQSRIGI